MNVKNQNKLNKKKLQHSKNKVISDAVLFRPFVVFIIIFIISLVIYGGSIKNDIVYLDDDVMFDNLKMLHQNAYNLIHEAYSRDAMVGIGGDLYRPVQTFSLILIYSIGKGSLIHFHLFQILLHVLACFIIFTLLTTLSFEKKKALILTLIYTVHPLFAPLVSFVPALGDQLLLILGVGSFVSLIYYLKTNKIIYLIIHLLTFSLAVFTKETALVFPAIFLFYTFFIHKLKKYKILLLPLIFWILLPLLYLFIRQRFILPALVAPHNVLNFSNASKNFLYNIPSFFEFISKFFLPYKLSFLAPYSSFRTVIALILIALFISLAVFKKLDYKWLLFSILWYSAFVLPPMLYTNPVFDYGEHRGFLPLVSFLLMFGAIKTNKNFYWLFYILIPVFAYMSFVRKNDFKDPLSFYGSIIDNDPVPIAYLNRGAYIHKYKKDINAVMDDYNNAIKLKKDYSTALYNRAILKSEELKDFEGAFIDLEAAIKAKPNYADAFYHRGYLKLTHNNDLKSALIDIDSAIVLNPSYVLAYNNRGILRMSYLNDTTQALTDFNKSINIQVLSNPIPYFYRGLCSFKSNDIQNACKDWGVAQKQGHAQAKDMMNSYCK